MVWTSIKARVPVRPVPPRDQGQSQAAAQPQHRPQEQDRPGSSMPTPPRTTPSPSAPPWVSSRKL